MKLPTSFKKMPVVWLSLANQIIIIGIYDYHSYIIDRGGMLIYANFCIVSFANGLITIQTSTTDPGFFEEWVFQNTNSTHLRICIQFKGGCGRISPLLDMLYCVLRNHTKKFSVKLEPVTRLNITGNCRDLQFFLKSNLHNLI